MSAPLAPVIAPLSGQSLLEAAEVLARAFRDNPLNTAVLRSRRAERRQRANAHGMRSLLPVARAHGLALEAQVEGRVAGVLVSTPPHSYPLPPPGPLARVRTLLGQGWCTVRRWGQVFDALYAHHPRYPHWYLATLGVAPELQGCGLGTGLLEHWLETVDPDGVSSYLETDRARNVPFYERAGFQVVGEARVFDVPVWLMRRPAGGR